MCFFTKLKINKFVSIISLLLTISILSVGCITKSAQRSGFMSSKESLEAILYGIGSLGSLGVIPRALPVPIISGETPYAFVATIDDASVAVLMGFSGFTTQEISETADQIVPFAESLLEETLGGSVTSYSPAELAGSGLADAQAVHTLVVNDLLEGMDFFVRCYVSKVEGSQGSNIRMDFYGWATDLLEPGQFLIRIEFQESLFNQLLQMS